MPLNKFHCETCGKQCMTMEKFIIHMKCHDGNRSKYGRQHCIKCDKSFSKKKYLDHLKTAHQAPEVIQANLLRTKENLEKKIYRCRMCVFESFDESVLNNHVSEEQHEGHLFKQEVFCPFCQKKFNKGFYDMKLHIDVKHPDSGVKNYFCDVCNKGFIYEFSYKLHDHIKEKLEPNKQCKICDDKVLSLKAHRTEKHSTCSYCDWKTPSYFEWQNALQYHIDSNHKEQIEAKFFCDFCPKSFIFENVFSLHMRNSHTKTKKSFICEVCAAEYTSSDRMKEHKLRSHPSPDATDFVCDVCGFSTFLKTRLRRHKLEKHEIEKHKTCPYCEYRSPDQKHVERHIDSKHPEHGEKQFFCDTCGKGFIFQASLKDHPKYYCPKNPNFKGRNKKVVANNNSQAQLMASKNSLGLSP